MTIFWSFYHKCVLNFIKCFFCIYCDDHTTYIFQFVSLLWFLWILFQVDCLFLLHIFGLLDFYSFPLSAACSSVFSFCLIYCNLYILSAGCKVIVTLTCGVCPQRVGRASALWRLSGCWDSCLCSCGHSQIFSLWKAVLIPVVYFAVSLGLVCLWAPYLLMGRIVFLFYWLLGMMHPPLELADFLVGSCLDVEMKTFGRALIH